MKLFKVIPLLILFGFAAACSTTESAQSSDSDQETEKQTTTRESDYVSDSRDYFRSLADFLERVPGVNVSGGAQNAVVTIRGINSFNSGIEPLFLIDGQVVGSTYEQANNLIDVRDIDYVRVLKGSEASIYGVRGGNGVILIYTKK